MIRYIAPLGFWVAVVVNLILWRNTREHSTFWAVLMLALGLSIQIEQLYFWLDSYIGGRNWLAVVSDVFVLVGVAIITNGITQKLTGGQSHTLWLVIATSTVAVALAIIFATLPPKPTTTGLTLAYRDYFATHLYNIVLFAAFAIAFAYTAFVCATRISSLTSPVSRVGVVFIIVGYVAGLAMCAGSFTMTAGYLLDMTQLTGLGKTTYSTARTFAVLLVTIGMALPPAAAWLSNRNADLAIQHSIEKLHPIHERLETTAIPDDADDRQRLTLMIVNINSEILRHGEDAILQGASPDLLDQAEATLLSQKRRTAYTRKKDKNS